MIAWFSYTTESKVIFATPQKTYQLFLLTLSKLKTSLGESPWLTGRHVTPLVTLVLVSPCYLQDAMRCHASGHLVNRECYGFERAFYTLKRFFTWHSFLLVLRLPWGRQFNLKASWASCWSSKHSIGPNICLNHNNPQKSYTSRSI